MQSPPPPAGPQQAATSNTQQADMAAGTGVTKLANQKQTKRSDGDEAALPVSPVHARLQGILYSYFC